ncbi:MAG: CopD family protein [Planctomycetes bacterium]|nr:CopD family protein [Planctomycetota bacterium]
MYAWLVVLHVLGAAIWTGGHLVLATTVLPRVLRERDVPGLLRFEEGFETIGMPALLVQIVTGILLALHHVPDMARWFAFDDRAGVLVFVKLLLLAATAALALHAKQKVLPGLDAERLPAMAWHIVPVTVLAVLFVFVGVAIRTGGLV